MMGRYMSLALTGLLFGAGLTVSGMVNPMKVLNFLDLAGQWDATLITVMGGGLAVTLIGYRIIFARQKPLFAAGFLLPGTSVIDAKLLGGAALFGAGWGLSGFCPAWCSATAKRSSSSPPWRRAHCSCASPNTMRLPKRNWPKSKVRPSSSGRC
jgi:uncharacterized membrane protein YedE/YeeE